MLVAIISPEVIETEAEFDRALAIAEKLTFDSFACTGGDRLKTPEDYILTTKACSSMDR